MDQKNYQALLDKQLEMNKKTWEKLRNRGISENSLLNLDFLFYATHLDSAINLKSFLESETDYQVKIETDKDTEDWFVTGKTQKTNISLDILNQWVSWMVEAGSQHGCIFDGWGTSVSVMI